tara:strand:- start:2205 stop:3167 length:963 start_codon:yes stop_codon:yes gene_type:complete
LRLGLVRPHNLWTTFLLLALFASVGTADFAGAFLQGGLGVRSAGMGGAFSAVVDDESGSYWNAARLTHTDTVGLGLHSSASMRTMSLGRMYASIAASLNSRGKLAFGLAWIHASVADLKARRELGELYGDIVNYENAFLLGFGIPINKQTSIGAGIKILRSFIDIPETGASKSTGRGLDLYLNHTLTQNTEISIGIKDLSSHIRWMVKSGSDKTKESTNSLRTQIILGASHRPVAGLVIAADCQVDDMPVVSLGAEWNINPMLTVRSGMGQIDSDNKLGSVAFGFTLRPMRVDTVQLHYAYVSDNIGAGDRTMVSLGTRF